ncbi:MAG: glycosyltransferase family 2 protein [Chloroflexota bacterium]
MRETFATVIIPNYNGAHLLPTCLDALRRQTFGDFEIVVVDNASSDGSRLLLSEHYPEVRVLAMSRNLVFAGAVNAGIRHSQAPMVVLLNNDTEADERWLAELAQAFHNQADYGWFACKMLLFDKRGVIDSAGDLYRLDGTPAIRGDMQADDGRFDTPAEVFGACGGAVAYRRAMLDDVGLFDEDLTAYLEDVDLNLRARLMGYRCYYVPTARVYHKRSATGGGTLASYLCGRNFILVAAKNLPGSVLRRQWARIFAAQLRLLITALRHGREPAARARVRGQIAGLAALPRYLHKRRLVQRNARISPAELLRSLT